MVHRVPECRDAGTNAPLVQRRSRARDQHVRAQHAATQSSMDQPGRFSRVGFWLYSSDFPLGMLIQRQSSLASIRDNSTI